MQPTGTKCAPEDRPDDSTAKREAGRSALIRTLTLATLLGLSLLWAYWPALASMAERWSYDPRYSHGYLVPAFALFLLWHRREVGASAPSRPSAWGLLLIAVGVGVKLVGAYIFIEWIDAMSLLPMLAGAGLLLGGRRALLRAWPSIVFLIFMIPLPYRVESAMGQPLRRLATTASTYALQTLGLPAVAEGDVIAIGADRIGVVEACNGLGMLFMALAFSTAAAFLVRRPASDRLLLVLSSAPIALAVNAIRITTTGFLHVMVGGKFADAVFHDLAGWLMMPLTMAALCAELWAFDRLFVEPVRQGGRPVSVDLTGGIWAGPARGPGS